MHRLLLFLAASLILAGCGQKGPLYLPKPATPLPAPSPSAQASANSPPSPSSQK